MVAGSPTSSAARPGWRARIRCCCRSLGRYGSRPGTRSASRAMRPPACSSGSQAIRTGTSVVSSSRARRSAGSPPPGISGGPKLTRGWSLPPARATRSRMNRFSVGVPACISTTVPGRLVGDAASSSPRSLTVFPGSPPGAPDTPSSLLGPDGAASSGSLTAPPEPAVQRDRPVGQQVQVVAPDLLDLVAQVGRGPVRDADRGQHRDVDGARVQRGGVAAGHRVGVPDHDRDHRQAGRHGDPERPLLERAYPRAVQPGSLRGDQDRQSLTRRVLDRLESGTAAVVSDRSINAASSSLPSVPTRGLLASSFLATPVQLSLTNAATMNTSKLLRWLNRKTAGRCAVRFSAPITFNFTPLSASTVSGQNLVRKLTPARLFRVSTPTLSAPAATGPSEPSAARFRARPSGPPLPRLCKRRTGQPRRAATRVRAGPGLTGRGCPTRYMRARSSSPSA